MAPKHTIGVDVCVAIVSYFGLEEQVHPILLDPAPELWHSLGYLIGLTWKNTSQKTTQSKIQVKFGTVHISSGQLSYMLFLVVSFRFRQSWSHTHIQLRQTNSVHVQVWLTDMSLRARICPTGSAAETLPLFYAPDSHTPSQTNTHHLTQYSMADL